MINKFINYFFSKSTREDDSIITVKRAVEKRKKQSKSKDDYMGFSSKEEMLWFYSAVKKARSL